MMVIIVVILVVILVVIMTVMTMVLAVAHKTNKGVPAMSRNHDYRPSDEAYKRFRSDGD